MLSDSGCPTNKWGVDCKQTCQDCYISCNVWIGGHNCPYPAPCSRWGTCTKTQWSRCGEGDLGLPRLRKPPNVRRTAPQSVEVSFSEWQEDYDDGERLSGASLTYFLQYWPIKEIHLRKYKTVQPNTTYNLYGLELGTTYHVQMLVRVEVDGEYCYGDATVHAFTTPCPDPQQPQGLIAKTNDYNRLKVNWQDVHYGRRCGFQYYLDVAPVSQRNYTKHFNTTDANTQLEGLQSNTEYIISIISCNQNKIHCSKPIITHTTLLELYLDDHHQNNVVVFNWGLVDGNVNNLQFKSYYEILSEGSIYKRSAWTAWSTETNRTIPVPSFSKVTLWVKLKTDQGQEHEKFKIVTVPPSEPGSVTKLEATVRNGTVLDVSWSKPGDNPPKGELEYFKVTWVEAGQADTQSQNDRVRLKSQETFHYDLRNLKPNTQYTIKVEAKNKNVDKYGVATTISATTTMGVPPQVKILRCAAGEVSLTFTWEPHNNLTSVTTLYTVILSRPSSNVLEQNTSTTSAKFEGLSNATKYEAKVKACNVQRCGDVQNLQCSTQPFLPILKGTVDLEAANDTTITILLPLITNPPGSHYVMVVREGRQPRTQEWKDTLTKTALNLIHQDNETERARSPRSATQEAAGGQKMYIETKVLQEGSERIKVTVGGDASYGDHYDKHPLEKDAAYWIVVVSEKTGGGHARYQYSTPMRFVAASVIGPGETSALIGGLCAVAVLIAAVTTVVIVYLRKRRNGLAGKPNCNVDTPACEPWSERVSIPLVATTTTEHQDHSGKEDIYANVTLQVNEKDLEAYLLRAVSSRDTRIEFDGVPSFMSNNFTESQRPENRIKNRYRNKICYDETRVILPLYNDIPHSDYINANHVKGPTRPAAFIATQGAKEVTVGAFWRMMWHSNCRVIVMVANLKEGKKEKVAQYWPEHEPWIIEGVTVTPTHVTVKMDFVIRTFTVSVGTTTREMSQYQYTAWPDHGVPNMPYGLAHMIKLIRTHNSHEVPLTVHCSAGIGRTGTVILVVYWMDQLEASGTVNPSGALSVLRCGRGRLVENTEQYIFAHQVLHEVLFGLDTSISCHAFEDKLLDLRSPQPPDGVSPIHQQHKKLKSLPKDLNFRYGKDPACARLNRNQDILPADNRMVFVQGQGYGTDNQYLNTIRINGVDSKDAYLVSEHPQSHTLAKMWRLVYERKVPVWVLIHTFPDHDPEFPDVVCESSALFNNMTLSVSPTQTFQSYNERRVDISVTESSEVNTHTCFVISLRGWPATACLPASPEPLIALLEKTEALSSQMNPPLFTCKDGVTGCGVVVGVLLAVSRAKVLQEVDIYRSVASVQQDRPQFVVNLDQYDFLYDAMLAFLRNNDHYGNFN